MAESAVGERESDEEMAACTEEEHRTGKENVSRKEKRKAMKKMKRKLMRKEIALKQRVEEEARLNDPEEQSRLQVMEQEEAESTERERKEFEEREKAWIEAMKKKKEAEEKAHREEEEEEERRKALEASREHSENEGKEEDDDWEYVEEGQPEIIWKGNEIIFKKKKVKVPKRNGSLQNRKEGEDRPTSNPLPPHSEAFADCMNASSLSSQQLLESVAQQVPNFGTEQDKAHCPFHLKTGACRFGQHCSRVHFYPDKSCTLLMKNMYNGPGLACDQDEGLEYTDEEIERCYEEFYEDVHTEFLKFGEVVNFKVCRNSAFHLRGNVYVQYKHLDSALLAYNTVNGRYFAGKQVGCEFVNITRWKIAICGEYMKSGFKTCSRGTACNFIHCFHNPGRDYEWADSDRPPPRYWMKKMSALFGHSDDHGNLVEQESLNLSADSYRHHSRSSRSNEVDSFSHDSHRRNRARDDKRQKKTHDETLEEKMHTKDNHWRKNRTVNNDFDEERLVEDRHRKRNCRHRRHSTDRSKDNKKRSCETDSDRDFSSKDNELLTHRTCIRTSSRYLNGEYSSRTYEAETEDSDGETSNKSKRRSSRHHNWEDKNTAKEDKLQEINRDGSTRKRHGYSRRHSHHGKTSHYYDYETSESFEQEGDQMQEEQRECHDYRRRSKKQDRENDKDVNWSSELTDDNEDGHGHKRKQRKRSAPQNRESEYSDDSRGRIY